MDVAGIGADGAVHAPARIVSNRYCEGLGRLRPIPLQLPVAISIAAVTHDGQRNFIVKSFRGSREELLVNRIGAYEGRRPFTGTDPVRLNIEADGNWTVTIVAIQCCASSGEFSGKSDNVSNQFTPPGPLPSTWEFTHDGQRNFIVRLHCGTSEQLVQNRPKTARSNRQIDIEPRVVAALRRHRTAQLPERLAAGAAWQDEDRVFCDQIGGPLDGRELLRSWFRPLLVKAGLPPVRFHDLRHSYASIALARGVHPKVVQEAMGHSTISVTLDTYSHLVPSLQRAAAREMGDALFGA